MDIETMSLSKLDWVVIATYGIGMLTVGWYYSRINKDTEDYMLGGRKMTSWRVGLSLFATMFSAVSYLAMPGEIVKYGPMILCTMAGYPFVYFVVGRYFIPYIMKLKISSAYELLESRLGIANRMLASVYFLIMRLVWMAVIIYMCSDKVIVPIMGWEEHTALWVSIVLGFVTIIYTSMGGLRGVVFTDVVQTFILFGGTILAIVMITNKLGGVSAWIPSEWPEHWAGWVFFDTKARVCFLIAAITSFGWYVCNAGSDQMAIQRYLATRDSKAARRMYLHSLISNLLVSALLGILGLALMAFFREYPELIPMGTTMTESADLLFPRFIVIGLPIGFSGLVLAGLLAAAMSSLSSGINSSCLVISTDFIVRFRKKKIAEANQVKVAKIISLCIGVVIVLLSLVIGNVKGNLLELTYKTINLLVAPLFVPFFMAMFVRSARPTGTFIGTIISAVVASLVGFSDEIFAISISFLWMIPASFVAGVVVSWVLSLLPLGQKALPSS